LNEPTYQAWFDRNFPDQTIFDIVEVPEPVREKVPSWIKNNAKWWSEGLINDSEFGTGIQYMIKQNVITIFGLPESAEIGEETIPEWVKINAGLWSDGTITEDEFVFGIKYLVEQGIIRI